MVGKNGGQRGMQIETEHGSGRGNNLGPERSGVKVKEVLGSLIGSLGEGRSCIYRCRESNEGETGGEGKEGC